MTKSTLKDKVEITKTLEDYGVTERVFAEETVRGRLVVAAEDVERSGGDVEDFLYDDAAMIDLVGLADYDSSESMDIAAEILGE